MLIHKTPLHDAGWSGAHLGILDSQVHLDLVEVRGCSPAKSTGTLPTKTQSCEGQGLVRVRRRSGLLDDSAWQLVV